ncbi:MAG: tellurite resistance/C4-dicarboxylate transporter family protein [Thermoplasmataceae archaeon]
MTAEHVFRKQWNHVAMDLLPAYFAMVMATGIVSIASALYGLAQFAHVLFYIDLLAYIILWIFSAERLLFFRNRYAKDLQDHARGPGFFTVVAGTNTLGSVFVVVMKNDTIAFFLWIIGFALWLFYQYYIFTALSISKSKPLVEKGINGTWLVAIVSTQSVAVLAAQLSHLHQWMFLLSVVMYMIGWMTYILVMSLINYRLLFLKLDTDDIMGPYWINMGATAITTLAGSLILIYGNIPAFSSTIGLFRPFITGATFLMWAYGSWWIPWLVIIGIWKYSVGGDKIASYDPLFWGGVFPMGMYTVSTYMLVKATSLNELSFIPKYFLYVAIIAWIYEFLGLLIRIAKRLSGKMDFEQKTKEGTADGDLN